MADPGEGVTMIFNLEIATEPITKTLTVAFATTGIAFISARGVDLRVSIVGILAIALLGGLPLWQGTKSKSKKD